MMTFLTRPGCPDAALIRQAYYNSDASQAVKAFAKLTGGFVLRFPNEDVPETRNVAITLVADNKLILYERGETPPVLARYNPDGSRDVCFGDEGKVPIEGGDHFYDARYEQLVVLRHDGGTIHASRYWL